MQAHLDVRKESKLVDQARAGDGQAFAELIGRYDDNVFRLVFHITRNREDAEDAVQEALFKAYVNLARFHGDSRFYTWLVRIAMNEALMKLRKSRPHRTVSLDEIFEGVEPGSLPWEAEDRENPETQYARQELDETVNYALRRLDPNFREVFMLRAVQQFSTRETAAKLRVSVTAVKTRLRRARLQLRYELSRSARRPWQQLN